MIREISEYEYLGNSRETINANMGELNVRMDRLYSDKEKWNSIATTFVELSSQFLNFITTVQTTSSDWKAASDLVYNVQGYWEEPISITYHKTFNSIANYVEVETWLNETFPAEDFSETQILRCDYLCKNYANDSVEGSKIATYDPTIEENLAATFGLTVPDVYKFLGFRNQLKILMGIFNYYMRKYSKKDLVIDEISELESFRDILKFNKNTDSFQSEKLDNFSQIDLAHIHSYFSQYERITVQYDKYVAKGYDQVPDYVYVKFEPKNIYNNIGGAFFFKNRNGRWTYHPYTTIEFCSKEACNDCYDSLNINELYAYRPPCLYSVKYVLSECEIAEEPYEEPYEEALSFMVEEVFDNLSDLLA